MERPKNPKNPETTNPCKNKQNKQNPLSNRRQYLGPLERAGTFGEAFLLEALNNLPVAWGRLNMSDALGLAFTHDINYRAS